MGHVRTVAGVDQDPDRRQTARIADTAIELEIGETVYQTENWSFGGCQLQALEPFPDVGDRIAGRIIIAGQTWSKFAAEVAWTTREGTVGLGWIAPDPHPSLTPSR